MPAAGTSDCSTLVAAWLCGACGAEVCVQVGTSATARPFAAAAWGPPADVLPGVRRPRAQCSAGPRRCLALLGSGGRCLMGW